jgi:hypothetical protein
MNKRMEATERERLSLDQLATFHLLGIINADREQAQRLVAAKQAEYAPVLARLKTSALLGLSEALLAEFQRRGGEPFMASAFDRVVREVIEER